MPMLSSLLDEREGEGNSAPFPPSSLLQRQRAWIACGYMLYLLTSLRSRGFAIAYCGRCRRKKRKIARARSSTGLILNLIDSLFLFPHLSPSPTHLFKALFSPDHQEVPLQQVPKHPVKKNPQRKVRAVSPNSPASTSFPLSSVPLHSFFPYQARLTASHRLSVLCLRLMRQARLHISVFRSLKEAFLRGELRQIEDGDRTLRTRSPSVLACLLCVSV